MSNNPLSIELQRFISRYIHSVEQLEILCLLAEKPAKAWSESEVFKSLQSSHESVAMHLRRFTDEKFLSFDAATGYRFSPENPDLAQLASDLVKIYRERRVAVIEAIYQMPLDPIQNFADAFRIRKDKP